MNGLIDESVMQMQADAGHRLQIDADMAGTRQGVRESLAAIEIRKQRRAAIERRVAELNREQDQAVMQHSETTAPIQEQLRATSDSLVQALVKKSKGTGELEDRMGHLNRELESANVALEQKTATLNQRRKLLEQELHSPALNISAEGALKNRLIQLTSPENSAAMFAVGQVLARLTDLLNGATNKASEVRSTYKSLESERKGAGSNFHQPMLRWEAVTKEFAELVGSVREKQRVLCERISTED